MHSGSSRLTRRQQCSTPRSSSSNSLLGCSDKASEHLKKRDCRVLAPRSDCFCSDTLRGSCCRGFAAPLENKDSLLLRSTVNRSICPVASGCEVAGVLSSQIDIERRLECLREKLALKSDFNLLQFWGLFDTEGRGYATPSHVQEAFNALGLDISLTQARLFAGKLNSDSEPHLRYADMARAFLPTKTRYAEAMINRISNGGHKCPAPLRHLAPETLEIVAAIFDLTLAVGLRHTRALVYVHREETTIMCAHLGHHRSSAVRLLLKCPKAEPPAEINDTCFFNV